MEYNSDAVYQRFDYQEEDYDRMNEETQSVTNRSKYLVPLSATTFALLGSASIYASTGAVVPPLAASLINPLSASPLDIAYEDVIHQISTVHDPTIDLCHNPYGNICGKFDRDYKLPADLAIQTWGFNQVEDNMAKESLVPLKQKCSEAVANDNADAWTTFMVCSFELCERDGRYYHDGLPAPTTPTRLDAYAPELADALKEYLPIVTMSTAGRAAVDAMPERAFKKQLASYAGDLHNLGKHTLVKIATTNDVLFNSGTYVVKLEGGQMFYSNKDQYSDEEQVSVLADHLTKILTMHSEHILGTHADADKIQSRVEDVISLEKEMANIQLSVGDKRDQLRTNLATTVGEVRPQLERFMDLEAFIQHQNAPHMASFFSDDETKMVVDDRQYLGRLSSILSRAPRTAVIDLLLSHALSLVDEHLTGPMRKEKAAWKGQSDGESPKEDTNQECQKWAADHLSWIVGRDIVQSADSGPVRRTLATQILNDIKSEYYDQVESSWWLDDFSREGAKKKLDNMQQQVGWPDWLVSEDPAHGYKEYFRRFYLTDNSATKPDLPRLEAMLQDTSGARSAAHFLRVTLELLTADHQEIINRIGEPIDFGIWEMYPQDVNAEYFPTTNVFMLPWGILQGPMMYIWSDGPYDSEEERMKNLVLKAVSYGGVGSVVSHEIMHGYDDDGRTHDWAGQLRPFSSPAADENFKKIQDCISDEYSAMAVEVSPGEMQHLNGALTMGENLADNGGLQTLTRLMLSGKVIPKEFLHETPLKNEGIETSLGALPLVHFGTLWCEKTQLNYAKHHAETDPHSPGDKRVVGVLSNLAELGAFLQCPSGTALNPFHRDDSHAQDDLAHRQQCFVW